MGTRHAQKHPAKSGALSKGQPWKGLELPACRPPHSEEETLRPRDSAQGKPKPPRSCRDQ